MVGKNYRYVVREEDGWAVKKPGAEELVAAMTRRGQPKIGQRKSSKNLAVVK